LGGRDLGGGYGGVYSLVFPVHGKPKTLCYFLFPSNLGLLNIEDSVGIDLLWFCVYGFVGSPKISYSVLDFFTYLPLFCDRYPFLYEPS
jgi:hypothetical protein